MTARPGFARLFDTTWGLLLARVTNRQVLKRPALQLVMWFDEIGGEVTTLSSVGDPWQRLAALDQDAAEIAAAKLVEAAALLAGPPDEPESAR
jgi:hypothetical protein